MLKWCKKIKSYVGSYRKNIKYLLKLGKNTLEKYKGRWLSTRKWKFKYYVKIGT